MKHGDWYKDLTGKIFGRLTVNEYLGSRDNRSLWKCTCACGMVVVKSGNHLARRTTKSCGCLRKATTATTGRKNWRPNKLKRDAWYKTCQAAWSRAKIRGMKPEFSSIQEFSDYCKSIAPTHCPALGVELKRDSANSKTPAGRANSPSIDRIDSSLPYTPGNIQIISVKANCMKYTATKEELQRFAEWVLG